MAHVAQLEAGLISERTKAALGAAKARGRALGGYRGVPPTDAAREASKAALAARTAARANDLRPTLEELKKSGVTSLSGIARELTARGIPTPRGGAWSASQVSRALAAAKML
ncbi:MAG: recombinase family protein [Bauldia sp.]